MRLEEAVCLGHGAPGEMPPDQEERSQRQVCTGVGGGRESGGQGTAFPARNRMCKVLNERELADPRYQREARGGHV